MMPTDSQKLPPLCPYSDYSEAADVLQRNSEAMLRMLAQEPDPHKARLDIARELHHALRALLELRKKQLASLTKADTK